MGCQTLKLLCVRFDEHFYFFRDKTFRIFNFARNQERTLRGSWQRAEMKPVLPTARQILQRCFEAYSEFFAVFPTLNSFHNLWVNPNNALWKPDWERTLYTSQGLKILRSTGCICVFCVDLRTNSDYFPIQH